MFWPIPSLAELRERLLTTLDTLLPDAQVRLPNSPLGILGKAASGQNHAGWVRQARISRQIHIMTSEAAFLDRYGSLYGIERLGATGATGTARVVGEPGSAVPADTILQREEGVRYRTTSLAVVGPSAEVLVEIEAVAPGAASAGEPGQPLLVVSPPPGIAGTATVVSLSGGTDAEGDARYRSRLQRRVQRPPHGGNENDYLVWAFEVAGVTAAWPSPGEMGAGTVTLRFLALGHPDSTVDGIPSVALVQEVQAWLDRPFGRPITAEVFVVAPLPRPLNVTISGLTPDVPAVRAAIEAELRDMLTERAEPGGVIYNSWIVEAVSRAAGESHHQVIEPVGNLVPEKGEIAVLGTLTYV
ncbi:baseplate J/gp47 family protein [Adonisia turfae]